MARLLACATIFCLLSVGFAYGQEKAKDGAPPAGRGMRGMMRGGDAGGETAQQQVGKPIPPLDEMIKKLSETLTDASLVGVYTTDNTDSERPAREDKYTLGKVSKLPEADLWSFEAKIAVGGGNMTLPVVVAVKWAGDTPMIQLSNTTIPGMGTYSARVFLYEGRYAGTWQHGPAGGAMYGRIVREDKKAEAPAAAK